MATRKRRIESPEKYEIAVTKEAKADVLEITKWYNRKADGLGDRFEEYMDEAIEKLTIRPFAFSYLVKEIRRIKLNKFPYFVFYEIAGNIVNIYGVIHNKRKPATYKKRLRRFL